MEIIHIMSEVPHPHLEEFSLEPSREESEPQGRITMAIQRLREIASEHPLKSKIRKGLRFGALLIGISTALPHSAEARMVYSQEGGLVSDAPGEEALAVTPEARIEQLNERLAEAEKELQRLQKKEESLEHRTSESITPEQARELRQVRREKEHLENKIQADQLMREELASRLDDRAYEQLDRSLTKVAEAKAEGRLGRAERLERVVSLRVYERASAEMETYMASIGIQESGRRIIVPGVMGELQPVEIVPGFVPDGFYRDERKDTFTIVFRATDGSYYGLYFKNGKMYKTGQCQEYGRFIEE
ncbi:hypothetical protein A2239_03360 [Candidatus Uhrbacteria bacterium RIFOXYA2_FULL_40_9]|nr:MAG: hypothetical protein UT94_C0056G0003 [Candidatus Uhrbacteria bacterium GW2011_GWF2_40_263]OGL91935.1 MAG: hypothetical protein A2239_03360 [Candidatus Uhrbacteria bacterium RIFOXYA2_FULL_40_9]OGL96540.1 MAG: hypothetical protein A2332_01010 [Candidatus Uhrbacteria bacterium RIFOXYB2_FULL_41_18]HBK34605.1 hypothetical protein [Candidatus Uhrbacteria bacterium]HCB55659.1 hypothetical protein [Candidatus Uhrbacteria bacterium]